MDTDKIQYTNGSTGCAGSGGNKKLLNTEISQSFGIDPGTTKGCIAVAPGSDYPRLVNIEGNCLILSVVMLRNK